MQYFRTDLRTVKPLFLVVVHDADHIRALRSGGRRTDVRHRSGIHHVNLIGRVVRDEQITGIRINGDSKGAEHIAGYLALDLKRQCPITSDIIGLHRDRRAADMPLVGNEVQGLGCNGLHTDGHPHHCR